MINNIKKISFIIPCYNTTDAIHDVINEISDAMKQCSLYGYEIILVNDASPDPETWNRLVGVVNQREETIILLDVAKNSGQSNAILAGLRYGSGNLYMTSDDDGQTPMNYIPQFIKEIEQGKDVVCAKYTRRPQKSIVRKLGTYLNNVMSKFLIPRPKGIEMSTIIMIKKFVRDEMIKYDQPFTYISGLILRITHNIGNVAVEQKDRKIGTSGYSFKKLVQLWMNGATSFSIKPLRAAGLLGFFVAICGFIMALVTVALKMLVIDFQAGWSSMISLMLFLFGINLLMLGFVGEYIGRMYLAINKTPQVVVKNIYTKGG